MHKIEQTIILDKESPIFSSKVDGGVIELGAPNNLAVYIFDCSKALSNITSSMDKARLSLLLLDVKILTTLAEHESTKSDYIEMLIENSIIRVQSIYDRVLIFVNKILDLGISNDSITHASLASNTNVKKFEFDSKLKAINRECHEYRFIRNTVIHHGRYSEKQLDQLSLVISADRLSRETGGAQLIDPETLNSYITSYLNAKQGELTNYLDRIEEKLVDLYDAVLPIYDLYKDRLRGH